jgi:hypothetical protein
MKRLFLTGLILLLLASPVWAADWYVASTGDDKFACTDDKNPCATLAGAWVKAKDGDVINLLNETYRESEFLTLDKSITLRGQGKTIIDGEGRHIISSWKTQSELNTFSQARVEGRGTFEDPDEYVYSGKYLRFENLIVRGLPMTTGEQIKFMEMLGTEKFQLSNATFLFNYEKQADGKTWDRKSWGKESGIWLDKSK